MKSLKHLTEFGIIKNVSDKKWGQVFEEAAKKLGKKNCILKKI